MNTHKETLELVSSRKDTNIKVSFSKKKNQYFCICHKDNGCIRFGNNYLLCDHIMETKVFADNERNMFKKTRIYKL